MSRSLKDLFKRMSRKHVPSDPSRVELVERQTMIEGIGELRDKTVKEIMVPRVDVAFISRDITLDELYLIIAEEGYSRYPVYEQTIDNIVGILYVKDILRRDIQEEFDLPALMRKPYFIPESKHLDDLLRVQAAQGPHRHRHRRVRWGERDRLHGGHPRGDRR